MTECRILSESDSKIRLVHVISRIVRPDSFYQMLYKSFTSGSWWRQCREEFGGRSADATTSFVNWEESTPGAPVCGALL